VLEKIYHRNAERILFGREASPARPTLKVARTTDFDIASADSAAAWSKIEPTPLNARANTDASLATSVKMLYSDRGLYIRMHAVDRRITATIREDFADLWFEDVMEFFLWPDETHPVYFEYEISPLGYELPILVPNFDGKFLGWRPWHYEGDRKIKKVVQIEGGQQESAAAITGWQATMFVPYELLAPLQNVPPKPGTQWRANFYRMDYDAKQPASWDWSRVGPDFHEIEKFGMLMFE
jgi:hypothetical protein